MSQEASLKSAVLESSKKVDKKAYNSLKQKVKKLEENNYSRLILFESGNDWYKMAGNSMLIYYYEIAKKRLDLKLNIQPDTDYTQTLFEEGVLSFHGADSLEKKLKRLDILKERRDGGGAIVYELNFKISKEEIGKFHEFLLEDQERAAKILQPKILLHPEIYKKLRHIQKRTFEVVRKMSSFEREYNGLRIAEYAQKMTRYYMSMNNGLLKEKDGWEKICNLCQELVAEISIAMDLKEWRQDVAISIGEEVIETRRECEKRLKSI